jgi:Zn-finger nucleic acid-binding protein
LQLLMQLCLLLQLLLLLLLLLLLNGLAALAVNLDALAAGSVWLDGSIIRIIVTKAIPVTYIQYIIYCQGRRVLNCGQEQQQQQQQKKKKKEEKKKKKKKKRPQIMAAYVNTHSIWHAVGVGLPQAQ